ncbi:MAG: PIN domain-containing protein [Defluviitaleaceae bacterium]|nr:PIN domain-containing protein [Defluviitaleaceae bacterium]
MSMRKPKIYLETTVFNHYFDVDREAHVATVKLFEEIQNGKYDAYTSIYVTDELVKASEPKRSKMLALIGMHGIQLLDDDDEARRLADIYADEGIIPTKYYYDGLHIAIATANDLEYIFSLNFKHINKLKTKTMTSIINLREGYRTVTIASPLEVIEDDE